MDIRMIVDEVLQELRTVKDRVLYLLEKYPATRDNDFYLQYLYLKYFHQLPLPYLDYEMFKGVSLESVRRVRQKIQNEEHRYPSSSITRFTRKARSQAFRKAITQI